MKGGFLLTAASLVILGAYGPFCGATECSNGGMQYFNSVNCLRAMQTAAEDSNKFWFGNSYSNNCNGKSEYDSDCYNPRASYRDSLVSRIFQTRAYDRNTVQTVLKVTYKTHTGSYQACGNTYEVKRSKVVHIDPLMDDMNLTPFECVSRPEVSWEMSTTTYPYHTLAIVDAGYLVVQALYVNLAGNSLDGGQVVVEYQPPLNPTTNNNPYVFLLFEQNNLIQLRPETLHDLSLRNIGALDTFLTENSLRGPVGMSWFALRADPYSADNAERSPGRMNTCAYFVNEALKERYIPYLPQNRPALNTYLDITFDSPAFGFSCCCNTYSRKSAVFKPNPIGDGIGDAAIMRVNATFDFKKSTAFPSRIRDFGSDMYTMVMADPFMYTKALPHMHMLVTNIKNGKWMSGDHLLPYSGPWSPNPYYHRYYFLLFKQTVLNFKPRPENYSYRNCSSVFRGRCGFNMAALIQDGGLELVGASWQRVRLSDYVRCIYANLPGWSESEECAPVPDYSPTCSKSGIRNGAGSLCTSTGSLVMGLLVLVYASLRGLRSN